LSAPSGDQFTQQAAGSGLWIALGWCVGILVAAYVVSMLVMPRLKGCS
jgi:ABC-2 type transport system permease protein